jgi:hypothetical protein
MWERVGFLLLRADLYLVYPVAGDVHVVDRVGSTYIS